MSQNEGCAKREEIKAFIEEKIKPFEKKPHNFAESWPLFGEQNLFGLLSRACRNQEPALFEEHLVLIEELSKVSISGLLISFLSQGWIIECIERLATNEYHRQALQECKKGKKIGAFCLTEADYGSSYSNLSTYAVEEDGKWRIEGEKVYITNSALADYFIVVANTSDEGKQKISLFLLDKETADISIEERIGFMGNVNSGISKIKISCQGLDEKHLLGKQGTGFFLLPKCLGFERMDISLCSLYIAKEGLQRTLAFLGKRKNQEEKLLDYQVIRHKIVDMSARLELVRTYILSTAEKLLANEECSREVILCKILATEAARDILLQSMQLTGAYGFTKESGMITMFNDIAPLTVGGGANDALRNALFGLARSMINRK